MTLCVCKLLPAHIFDSVTLNPTGMAMDHDANGTRGASQNRVAAEAHSSSPSSEIMGDTIHGACGAIVDLHVNTHWTMRSQTGGGQQFQRHLLSSLQGGAPPPLNELRPEARPEMTEDAIGVTWQPPPLHHPSTPLP